MRAPKRLPRALRKLRMKTSREPWPRRAEPSMKDPGRVSHIRNEHHTCAQWPKSSNDARMSSPAFGPLSLVFFTSCRQQELETCSAEASTTTLDLPTPLLSKSAIAQRAVAWDSLSVNP